MYTSCIKPNCYCHSATQPHGQNKAKAKAASASRSREWSRKWRQDKQEKQKNKKKSRNCRICKLHLVCCWGRHKKRASHAEANAQRPWQASLLPPLPAPSPFHLLCAGDKELQKHFCYCLWSLWKENMPKNIERRNEEATAENKLKTAEKWKKSNVLKAFKRLWHHTVGGRHSRGRGSSF